MNNQLLKSLKGYFNFHKRNNEDDLIITFLMQKFITWGRVEKANSFASLRGFEAVTTQRNRWVIIQQLVLIGSIPQQDFHFRSSLQA